MWGLFVIYEVYILNMKFGQMKIRTKAKAKANNQKGGWLIFHQKLLFLTWGKYERLFVLSAYRLTALNSSKVILCCKWLECDECEDDECDRLVKRLGPSSETDKRAQDSSSVCSGIIPSDTKLLHTFELVAVKSAGVDWDSSWSVIFSLKICKSKYI